MTKVWKIAPGNGAEDWIVFRDHGCIGLGWLKQRDYRDFKSEDEVFLSLEQEYGENRQGYGKGAAEMIQSFVHEVEPDDIIVANDAYNRIVGIGIVEGNYLPPTSRNNPIRNDTTTHRHHVRLVNWVIRKPADIPGVPPKQYFFVQQTLKDLKPDQIEPIVQAYLTTYPNDPQIEQQLRELFGDDTVPNTQTANDLADPKAERVLATTYRILRDTQLARRVKMIHNYECQICGDTITLPDGSRYAEAHHIQPLGRDHNGPDIMGNIVCLCPNHHAECDLGVNSMSCSTLRHVDGHDVDEQFVEYHNGEIYGAK